MESSLNLSDHMWVIENFHKQGRSQAFHPMVTDILQRYLPRDGFKIYVDALLKPRVLCDKQAFYFSLSHSGDVLLLLVSIDDDVGVDVEFLQERTHQRKIGARFFGSDSMDMLNFYRNWTAREAFVKAIGSGIDKRFAKIQMGHQGQEDDDDDCLIGFDNRFSHRVRWVSFDDRYVIASCRNKSAVKDIVYFRRHAVTGAVNLPPPRPIPS